jgi:outer membrane protein assembly factor BamB
MHWLLLASLISAQPFLAQLPRQAPTGPHRIGSLAGLYVDHLEGDRVLGRQFGDLVAADLSTGKVLWRFEGATSSHLHEGLALISTDKKIVALSLADGKPAWTFENDQRVSQVVVQDGVLFFSDQTGLRALSLETRAPLWRASIRHHDRAFDPAIVATEGVVLTSAGRPALTDGGAAIEAHEITTGKLLWSFSTPTVAREIRIARGLVFAIAWDGSKISQLTAIELKTGTKRWSAQANAQTAGFDTILGTSGNLVIVQSQSSLVAFEADSGRKRWSVPGFANSGVVDDALVITGGAVDQPTFSAFDVKTGRVAWKARGDLIGLRPWRGGILTRVGGELVAYLPAGVAPPPAGTTCTSELLGRQVGSGGAYDAIPAKLARAGFPPLHHAQSVKDRETTEIFHTPECRDDALTVAKVLGVPEEAVHPRDWKASVGITIALGRQQPGAK